MKRVLLLSLLAVSLFSLVGCGSRYAVVTSDYSIHVATSKPELQPGTDIMTFENDRGEEISLQRSDIKQMKELK